MEKKYWKLGVLILIFLGLVGAGTLAVYQKLKVPLGQPAKVQAELSKTETAELEKPKQETENTEPKKELKKASKAKENEVSAKPPEPSMGISLADRDKKTFNWSLGLLAEANMNSPEACAMGTGLYTLLCFL